MNLEPLILPYVSPQNLHAPGPALRPGLSLNYGCHTLKDSVAR